MRRVLVLTSKRYRPDLPPGARKRTTRVRVPLPRRAIALSPTRRSRHWKRAPRRLDGDAHRLARRDGPGRALRAEVADRDAAAAREAAGRSPCAAARAPRCRCCRPRRAPARRRRTCRPPAAARRRSRPTPSCARRRRGARARRTRRAPAARRCGRRAPPCAGRAPRSSPARGRRRRWAAVRGRASSTGRSSSTTIFGGFVSFVMLRGMSTARPWRRRFRRMRYVPSGTVRSRPSVPSQTRRSRCPAGSRRSSTSVVTVSPSRLTTVAVTSSVCLSLKEIRARSKRPSRLGEKYGDWRVTSWTSGGLVLSSWAAKNAPNVAHTSTAKAMRAVLVTAGSSAPGSPRRGERPGSCRPCRSGRRRSPRRRGSCRRG